MRIGIRMTGIALIAVALWACNPSPAVLECIDVDQADCVSARDVALDVVGADSQAVSVIVRRYRPDFGLIGKPNPDFAAYVYVRSSKGGPASIILVVRQIAGEAMTGGYVAP